MKRILFLLAFTAITTFAFSQAKIYDGQTIKARAALIVGGKTITDIVDDTVMANKYESRLMSEWSIKTLFETFNGGSATIDTFSITTRNRDKKGLDSISQVMANNYTPTSRTITINGTTYDLSSNRTWSVGDAKLASTQTWTGVNTFGANITATNAFFNDYIYSGNNSNGRMYVGTYFNNATKSQVANNFVKQNINYYGFTQDTAGNVNIGAKSFVVNTDITASSFIKSGGTSSQFLKADGTTDNNSYTIANTAITGATKTKITYDAKGLITAGADATTTDIAEGTNLYYTNARARAALSYTAGSGAYNSSTGVITIPTNTNQLTNGAGFTTNTGTVTSIATSGTVSGLTLTGGTITTSGTITLGGSITGLTTSNLASNAGITNGQLANNKINIGGTDVGLGNSISKDAIMGISTDGILIRKGANTYQIAVPGSDYVIPSALSSYSLTSHNHTLDVLSNVTITSKATNDILRWSGSAWVNFSLNNLVSKWDNWQSNFFLENVSINYITKFLLPDDDDAAATNDRVEVKMPYWNGRMSVENYTFLNDSTYDIDVNDNIIFAENGATLTLPDISTVPVGKTYEFGIKNVSTWGEQYAVFCYEGDVLDVPTNRDLFLVKAIDTTTWTDKGFVSTKIVKGDNNKWLILQIQNPNY